MESIVFMESTGSNNRIHAVDQLHSTHAEATSAQRRLLAAIVACDRDEIWDDGAARDFPH
jgi:hypothetical protein